MKEIFREYYKFSPKKLEKLWTDCLFVFDTNSLLNMYRYHSKTSSEYLNVLEKLMEQKQLWIPYQVGFEFFECRVGILNQYKNSYKEVLEILRKTKESIKQKYTYHPFLDIEKIFTEIEGIEKKVIEKMESHPDWLNQDKILEKLDHIFKDNIGENYPNEKIDKIKEEGKKRYIKKIPPGFKDNTPDKVNLGKEYGDLIIWFQIIDKAIACKRPIIFVTNDSKEDWWCLDKNDKKIMPHPQLKREMYEKAKVEFHIYSSLEFLEQYKLLNEKTDINEQTIEDVKKIDQEEERQKTRPDIFIRNLATQSHYVREVSDMLKLLEEKTSTLLIPSLIKYRINVHLDIFTTLKRALQTLQECHYGNFNIVLRNEANELIDTLRIGLGTDEALKASPDSMISYNQVLEIANRLLQFTRIADPSLNSLEVEF